MFNQVSSPIQYTPRRFVIHQETGNLIMIETDHNAYTEETKQLRKQQMAEVSLVSTPINPESAEHNTIGVSFGFIS